MTRATFLALTFSALAACGENTSPTQSERVAYRPAGTPAALAKNGWVARARVPTARIDHTAGVVNNAAGQPVLYIFGGNDPIEEFPVRTIEAYNYVTNSWTTRAAQLELRLFDLNGVGAIGGKLYLSGGLLNTGDGFDAVPTLYVYDPVRDQLTRRADAPRPSARGVVGVIGGKLYLLIGTGGDAGEQFSRRFYRFNPATDHWTPLPWCPHIHQQGAAAVINGRFYVAGGFDGTGATTHLDAYDPATNQWKTLAPLPTGRLAAAGAAVLGKFYVIGGVGTGAGDQKVYAYDPVTNRWTTKAALLTGRRSLAAASLVTPFGNSKILAVGGFNSAFRSDTTAASANELYTP